MINGGGSLQTEQLWCPNTVGIQSAWLEMGSMWLSCVDLSIRSLPLWITSREWVWFAIILNRPICCWMSTTTSGCSIMDCFI